MQVYNVQKHLQWLIRFCNDREIILQSMVYLIFGCLISNSRCSSNKYNSSLLLILSKQSDLCNHIFTVIRLSHSALIRSYAIDCLNTIIYTYFANIGIAQKQVMLLFDFWDFFGIFF